MRGKKFWSSNSESAGIPHAYGFANYTTHTRTHEVDLSRYIRRLERVVCSAQHATLALRRAPICAPCIEFETASVGRWNVVERVSPPVQAMNPTSHSKPPEDLKRR